MSQKANISQKQAPTQPQSGGKKSVKDVHRELGFAPVEEAYKDGIDGMEIDDELKKELDEKQLTHRFINFKHYKEYGFHRRNWVPYKRESKPANGAVFNIDPNGFMTRGDLVLAVKPKDWNEAHRKELTRKNKLQEGIVKQKTKEFQQYASDASFDAEVDTKDD